MSSPSGGVPEAAADGSSVGLDHGRVLDRLRRYLVESEDSGEGRAEAEALYELAPDVFLVHDRYRSTLELDVYFDASADVPSHLADGFASRWGLKRFAGGACVRSKLLRDLESLLHFQWHEEAVEVPRRAPPMGGYS